MRTTARVGLACALSMGSLLACRSQSLDAADSSGSAGAGGEAMALAIEVGPDQRTFVELAGPSTVEIDGDGADSIAWDLAFQGRDIFTNGGISGPGNGSAFGPLSAPTFLSDTAPLVPLMLKDRAGGALIDWYLYGGATHQLFSRYHVFGLRDGARLFKLQVLSYYGTQLGAEVSALYRVRYAEVTADGMGKLHDVAGIDATAGGNKDDDQQPSACLELDTEQVTPLTPAEAAQSDQWQLCFRRDAISVNGGRSGPRGMEAVDLQSDATADETVADVQKRTPASEQAAFDNVDFATLDDPALAYRADGVVTAFGQRWLDVGTNPLSVSRDVWFVIGADGASKYLLELSDLTGDPAKSLARLSLDAKRVK